MNRPRLSAPEAIYLGSLLPLFVAAAALVWVRSWSLLVGLAVGVAALLGIGSARWLAGCGWRREWLLPVAVLNVLVLAPELALRAAPTAHDLHVPAYLVELGYADDTATVRALHRQYGDALRDGVARNGWMLLDLETVLADRPDRHALFLEDGIHFTERGLDVLAEHVSAVLVEILAARCEGVCRLP